MMKLIAAVAIGGAMGSILRYLMVQKAQLCLKTIFPLGVFLVNFLGCFLIGLCYVLIIERYALGPVWRAVVLIGFLGGFTTFSSFTMDTLQLVQQGNYLMALTYVAISVVVCFAANVIGMMLGRTI